jgi:hypothetical protein
MATTEKVLAGLAIIARYDQVADVSAEHDIIYAGSAKSHKDKLTEDEKKLMEIIGWHWDSEFDCWARFT